MARKNKKEETKTNKGQCLLGSVRVRIREGSQEKVRIEYESLKAVCGGETGVL